jgi:glycosyltransferase involved in cell wall biosynthesis
VRILLVNNYYPEHVGGTESVAATLAAGYRRHGHEVRWIAGDIHERPHAGHADDVPVRVWNGIERLGFPYPLPNPLAVGRIGREVGWSQVVHLHDCLYAVNIATVVAALRQRRPVLLTQHVAKVPYPNPMVRGLQSFAYASLGRAVLSHADQVVFESEEVQRWFEPRVRFRRPTLILENGVDIDMFQPPSSQEKQALRQDLGVPDQRPFLLFVGRFVQKKGVHLLRPLIEATPEWSWLLIGREGDIDPSEWRLPNMRVLAPVDPARLRDHYAAADLLVLPSTGEGMPVAAQEAMACGTPAFLSAMTAAGVPGIRDVTFSSSLGPSLDRDLRAAVAAVKGDSRFRERVAAVARDRWRDEASVIRYEEQLEVLLR